MKFALIAASLLSVASAVSIKGSHATAKLLSQARKLDQNAEADYGEYGYLTQYAIKMVGCKTGETVVNPESGEYEYNAAILRLCPVDSCDDDSGCDSGYGDLVIGLNTFVEAYFEDQRDNMNYDDQFKVDEYAECREFEVEQADGDDQNNNQQQQQYYIGPTCSDDGKGVKLAVFSDELCTYPSEASFYDISNGWTLPYEESGMVSTRCNACLGYNDNYEQELREICTETYQFAAAKCEEQMEYYSYYGQNIAGCDYIDEIIPKASTRKSGGGVFGWILLSLVIVGVVGYVMWWRNKKNSASDGLMN